jgi:mono/diheme cytochrome c family protein
LRAADAKADAEAAKKGEMTYVLYCHSCHGKAAKGDGPLAKDLKVFLPDLTLMSARNGGSYPYDRVVRIIRGGEPLRGHGTADMAAWNNAFRKTMGSEEAATAAATHNLTHYIWSLQRPTPPK